MALDPCTKRPFKVFGFMMDLARRIERPEVVCRAVDGMAGHGYNLCMLYLEDAYQFPRHPAIARKHAYSSQFMMDLQQRCARQGMELVPVFPSLGHCGYITRKPGYEHYDEGRGTDQRHGTLCSAFPETYSLLQELFEDWSSHVPGTFIHAAMDESPAIGQYLIRTGGPASVDIARLFADHCNRVNGIIKSLGRQMVMWGDMFYYLPEAIGWVDKDIIVADWYYYAFARTPRVELFNFTEVDSSRRLKEAGFSVWGIPSAWPNYPLADVRDRWQNLHDWLRYGREVGIDGLVNADWENSFGFYDHTDLLFRAMGDGVTQVSCPSMTSALKSAVEQMTQVPVSDGFIGDLVQMGSLHLTGHGNRAMHARPPATLAAKARQAECREKFQRLAPSLGDLPALLTRCDSEHGLSLLRSLDASRDLLAVTYQMGAELPSAYEALCAGEPQEARNIFLRLLGKLEPLAAKYREHWNRVRFDDDRSPMLQWIATATATLQEWLAAVSENPADHPLAATPRLEFTLRCRYPALPVLKTTVSWDDSDTQVLYDILIRFESSFAVPEAEWVQFSSHALKRRELPSQIMVQSVDYGQVGIDEVKIVHQGEVLRCEMVRTAGEHVQHTAGTLWLGPRGGEVGLPLLRSSFDTVWFQSKEKPDVQA